MLAGVGAFIGLFMVISFALVGFAATRDDFASDDVGNSFEKSRVVLEYADERLAAAATGTQLPAAPTVIANQKDLQFVLVMGFVSQVFLAALVVLLVGQGVPGFVRAVGLDRFAPARLFLIFGLVLGAYIGVQAYGFAAEATGIDWLVPKSTLPTAVLRSDTSIVITGLVTLVGAPLSEEMFFRGLVFSGLLRWGFWPAALVSGSLFSLVHFDPGSFLPFAGIGVLLCWVYWRRRSLSDAVAFHFVFNATSFVALLVIS